MIKGVTIDVYAPNITGYDRLNNPVYGAPTKKSVDNVLIVPGATDDLEAARPEGVTIAYTLHFPKTFTDDLEGCTVELPAPWSGTYRVVGKPGRYMDVNTPTPWNMPVQVEAAHG